MGLKQQIMDFLSTLGDDTEDEGAEAVADEEATAEEGENDAEAERDDAEAGADDAEAEAEEHADGEADAEEGTPGTAEEGSAEDADLRATITEQAALIETLRNTIAELGGDDPTETAADLESEIVADDTEDDLVAAFETDYAERQARLAEIND